MITRRIFVQSSAFGAVALTRSARASTRLEGVSRHTRRLVGLDDLPRGAVADPAGVRVLAQRALDVATAAGASYVDVRLTRAIREAFYSTDGAIPTDEERLALGVRVLIGGCWGFAARSRWSLDEVSQIATEAVRQAKANAAASPQSWTPAPRPVATGHWQPPTVIDPFVMSPEEKLEQLRMIATYVLRHSIPPVRYGRYGVKRAQVSCDLTRTEWTLAASDGTYCTQHRYTADGSIGYTSVEASIDPAKSSWGIGWHRWPWRGLTGQGWEYCDPEAAYTYVDTEFETEFNDPSLTRKPVDIGRYDVVCAAPLAAEILGRMFGPPLELDRILGLEANAAGTSYLTDPLATIGTLSLGSPLLTVTGNRTDVGGLATTQWDDDGVAAPTTSLVTGGVLTDYVTTRESAARLAPWYEKHGKPVQSTGCAMSDSALSIPLAHPPNIALAANRENVSFDDLVRDTKRGVALFSGAVDLDFQGRMGMVNAENKALVTRSTVVAREIVNGTLGRAIDHVGVLLNSMQFWKELKQVGGAQTRQSVALQSVKGEPEQSVAYTASAVPVKLTNVTIVDLRRQM